jgi:Asp-tRNA(Asn)/Glu-tRNA(Gln) amidotransferase A subunit family amidase
MLGVMAGVDPGDPATSASGRPAPVDYTAFLDANGLSGARLGVLTSFTGQALAGANEEFDAAFAEALATMAGRGAALRQGLSVPAVGSDEETIGALTTLAVGRFSEEFAGYFAAYPHQGIQSFDDVLARARALGPGVVKNLASLEASVASPASAQSWADAHALRSRMIAAALKTMDDAQVDALVFLTLSCPATPLPGVVDPGFKCKGAPAMPYKFGQAFGGEGILLASMTGLPEVTVPAGFTADGVPIALSFFGRPFSEATLIKLAYAYEQASRKRRAPQFLR